MRRLTRRDCVGLSQRINQVDFHLPALLFTLWLVGVLGAGPVHALEGDGLRSIPNREGATAVRIGVYIVDITGVDEKEETLDVEANIVMMWKDERQAYDPADLGLTNRFEPGDYASVPDRLYQGDFAVKEIYQGWRPHVTISNGIGDRQVANMMLGIWPDGTMGYAEDFHATIESPMQLRRFPFDRQQLRIYFRPFVWSRKDIVLVPDEWLSGKWERDIGIDQWTVNDVAVEERPLDITYHDGTVDTISEYIVTVDLQRIPTHFIISIVVPLVVLVSLTWSVFWMDEEGLSNRISLSFIGILTVVAYYFILLDYIPKIPYLTLMDGFILSSFFLLAASVVISLVVDKLNRANRKEAGDKLDYVCRWAFPLGFVTINALLAIVYFYIE